MTTHDLIQDQPTVAFAGAQRASKYIEATASPIEPAAPVTMAVDDVPFAPEADTEDTVAHQVPGDDVDLGTLSIAVAPRVAQRGARGMLAKLGLKVGPGSSEMAAIDIAESQRRFEDIIRQATWTRAVSILIANPKGGVGKTPTALLLGGMLAAVRGGSVCIMEVSDDPGALTFRSEGAPTRGLGELIRDAAEIRSAGQLAGYTAPQTSFAAVVGSVGPRPRLEGEDVTAVAKVIDDYFSLRVMDRLHSGPRSRQPTFWSFLSSTPETQPSRRQVCSIRSVPLAARARSLPTQPSWSDSTMVDQRIHK